MTEITIIKQNVKGEETWRYSGRVMQKNSSSILIEANFNRPDTPFHGIVLGRGDRFVEIYYSSRWYNIFEIHDREDDRLKGWYCNVTRPAVIYDDASSMSIWLWTCWFSRMAGSSSWTRMNLTNCPSMTSLVKKHGEALQELQQRPFIGPVSGADRSRRRRPDAKLVKSKPCQQVLNRHGFDGGPLRSRFFLNELAQPRHQIPVLASAFQGTIRPATASPMARQQQHNTSRATITIIQIVRLFFFSGGTAAGGGVTM
jgi:hypothetical protein